MIKGFHVHVSSKELIDHLEARAAHHANRDEWYRSQAKQFEDAEQPQHTSNNPAKSLQDSGKAHANKAQTFAFMAKHVPADEVFELSNGELSTLELVTERIY